MGAITTSGDFRKNLSSLFQLTGNPRWDNGGDLYEAYDLGLSDPVVHVDRTFEMTENIISEGVMKADFFAGKGINKTGYKVLSTKSNEEIKKNTGIVSRKSVGRRSGKFTGEGESICLTIIGLMNLAALFRKQTDNY